MNFLNFDKKRVKYLARLNADLLTLASVTYAAESVFNPNPFNQLLYRHEPHSYWGICNVMGGFRELLKYDLTSWDVGDMRGMLFAVFRKYYGDDVDPLDSVGASNHNWPLQYAPRARECIRIADFILYEYT